MPSKRSLVARRVAPAPRGESAIGPKEGLGRRAKSASEVIGHINSTPTQRGRRNKPNRHTLYPCMFRGSTPNVHNRNTLNTNLTKQVHTPMACSKKDEKTDFFEDT